MMGSMEATRSRSRTLGSRAPTARSVLLRFALGSAAAIAVAVVGGYFALRSVAIDEAKRETRTKVQEAAQLVESSLDDGLVAGEPSARETIDDVVARPRSERLDRAREDLVGGRARPVLGRPCADRWPLRARRRSDATPARGWRRGGGERPRPPRERARPWPGRADRGVHADQDTVGDSDAVRDLPALRLGHRERAAPARSARPTAARSDRPDRARPGSAHLVADAQTPAGTRRA